MSIWSKIYSKINWKDEPIEETPLSARNLNKIDSALDEIDKRVVEVNNRVETLVTAEQSGDEVTDIRVGYDGSIYPSAGASVRSQVSKLSESIDENYSELKGDIVELKGEYRYLDLEACATRTKWRLNIDGTVTGTSLNSRLDIYKVIPNSKIRLKLEAVLNSAIYQFQTEPIFVTSGETDVIVGDTVASAIDGIITVPNNAEWICVCRMIDSDYVIDMEIDNHTITTDVSVSVGDFGDFKSISKAIDYLMALRRTPNVKGIINITFDAIIREQVVADSVDMSWISIISDGEVIVVDCANLNAITVDVPDHPPFHQVKLNAIFTAKNNGYLPKIKALFKCTNVSSQVGVACYNGGRAFIADGCGVQNAYIGMYLIEHGYANAMGANFDRAIFNGISCFRTSSVIFGGGSAIYCGSDGIYVDDNSNAELSGANFEHATKNGIEIGIGSVATIIGINCSYCSTGILAYNGGMAFGRSTDDGEGTSLLIDCTSCKQYGLRAYGGAKILASGADCSNAGVNWEYDSTDYPKYGTAVYAHGDGEIIVTNADCTKATGRGCYAEGGTIRMNGTNAKKQSIADTSQDIECISGGTIYAYGAQGGKSKTVNVFDANGVIFQ